MRDYIREQRAKDPKFNLKSVKPTGTTGTATTSSTDTVGEMPVSVSVPGIESIQGMKIGDRCEVTPGARRGAIAFLGEVSHLSAGYWVSYRNNNNNLSNDVVSLITTTSILRCILIY